MTGQALLDRMELLNQEMQLQSGESNVTRGLLALNVAQDFFEGVAATRGKMFGGQTGTVVTAGQTETTAYPTGLLRLDRMQLLDTNSRPKAELIPLRRTGGHAATGFWPLNVISVSSQGEPQAYWSNGTSIYWAPLPSGVSTVRWYGLQAATDITASGTFLYPDIVALPLAAFAVRIFKYGLDDDGKDVANLAVEAFNPVLDTLSLANRDGAVGLEYTRTHEA